MCTAMSVTSKNKNQFFGRTMDFSYELNPEIYISPRDYKWDTGINNNVISNKYKFIGIGQDIGKITFADGANELGLAGAVLFFPGYADYSNCEYSDADRISIASIDIMNYILGNCSDIQDVIKKFNSVNIVGVEDSVTNSVAPLHWIFVDKKGKCITIEKTANGLKIFDNQLKVLANSPDFDWHMTNLRNYINISPVQQESVSWEDIIITPFGQGAGTFGLPGDYTSPSRFLRTAYLKSFTYIPEKDDEVINTCFNIMKGVTIPKGTVITKRGTNDYTQYTAFINIDSGDYYFNTYSNNQITKANINQIDSDNIISLGKINKHMTFN